jgi:hypothetical protein
VSSALIIVDASGTVFKGSWNKTEVAIKVFKLEGNIKPGQTVSTPTLNNDYRHSNTVIFFVGDSERSGDLG